MKRLTPYMLKGGLAVSLMSGGYIFLKQKDLRESPIQIAKGSLRQFRLLGAGMKMALIYKNPFTDYTMEERHQKSAEVLRKTFEKNAGTFIKLG